MSDLNSTGLVIEMSRGPFQNNGATPWYCVMGVGTPPQPLYFCFDTGSNFNWVTSSLCGEDGCVHYAGHQFQINQSTSFQWISKEDRSVSFGPWGTMLAKLGSDDLSLNASEPLRLRSDLLVSSKYKSQEFADLDWDGGIGLGSSQIGASMSTPSPLRLYQTQGNENEEFDFFRQLIQSGHVSHDMPYMSFVTQESKGFVGFGILDNSYANSLEYVFLPWQCYQEEASYLWTTSNASIGVKGQPAIGKNLFFALDSGSSQFKGDNTVLTAMFNATQDSIESVIITLHDGSGQPYSELTITSDLYQCEIEAGKDCGKTISQFKGLDHADGMLLVGSVLMDHLYTIYEYHVDENLNLSPKGMWIFNKPDGPKIISNKQSTPANIFHR